MPRPRIAFICQPIDAVLPPQQNSIGLCVYEFARRLAADHEVTVYLRGEGRRIEQRVEHGVAFRQVPRGPDLLLQRARARLRALLPRVADPRRPEVASRWHYLPYAVRIARDLRRRGCDVALIMNFTQFAPVIAAVNPRVRIVLNMHCEWLSQLDPRWIAPRLARTHAVMGVSRHVTELVRARFPDTRARLCTVHLGVDPELFAPAAGAAGALPPPAAAGDEAGILRLLYVGRVSPEKGIHDLIEAMAMLSARRPSVRLTLLGGHGQLPLSYLVALSDDPQVAGLARFYRGEARDVYIGRLRERVRELGLQQRVEFAGSRPYQEVLARCRTADVLVNPSLSESFGRAPVEAMACGVPVVGTRVGGMLDTIDDGQTGLLVPPGDPAALAEALERLLGDAALRRRLGEAGRARVERLFAWDRVTNALRAELAIELRAARGGAAPAAEAGDGRDSR